MIDNILKSQAFKLKGRIYTLTVVHLLNTDAACFEQQLMEVIAQAPRMFDHTPVVFDCSGMTDDLIDLRKFVQIAQKNGLMPVGVQGTTSLLSTIAQAQGLAVFHASSNHDKLWTEEQAPALSTTVAVTTHPIIQTKLLQTPIRSGQQVFNQDGDLIITASVSHGAELLANGNIHVYGALRGRALAGITGNKQARIFCQSLNAELVSIAGIYRLSDAIESMNVPCQIFIQEGRIQIEPL